MVDEVPSRVILGIDAAWTGMEPSGVAVIAKFYTGWRCAAVAPSYSTFLALAENTPVDWLQSPEGNGPPCPAALLAAAARLAGGKGKISVVTADIPLATVPIVGRRQADTEISRAFGERGCAAHSPNEARPGPIGEVLRDGFAASGFPLATTQAAGLGRLVEVYPHPALLTLLAADYRIPYKVSRSGRYWRGQTVPQRIANLLCEFRRIVEALGATISGINIPLPGAVNTLAALKRYEDAIDAVVCAWVGIHYLAEAAAAYGDETAAVWVPNPGV